MGKSGSNQKGTNAGGCTKILLTLLYQHMTLYFLIHKFVVELFHPISQESVINDVLYKTLQPHVIILR